MWASPGESATASEVACAMALLPTTKESKVYFLSRLASKILLSRIKSSELAAFSSSLSSEESSKEASPGNKICKPVFSPKKWARESLRKSKYFFLIYCSPLLPLFPVKTSLTNPSL